MRLCQYTERNVDDEGNQLLFADRLTHTCRRPTSIDVRYRVPSFQIISELRTFLEWLVQEEKKKASHVFKSNPQGSRLRGRPKNRWWNYVQTDINIRKITNWNVVSKI